MEGKDLRKADLVSSVLLFMLGIFIIIGGSRMPMKDTYGGVRNVWYVSPALFPLIIGTVIILLSLALFVFALKKLGREEAGQVFTKIIRLEFLDKFLSERNIRFTIILALFLSYVYLFIPRIDYLLCTALFLFIFISIFYYQDFQLQKRLFKMFLAGSATMLLYFLLGINGFLNQFFEYTGDILILIFFLVFLYYNFSQIKGSQLQLKRFWVSLVVSLLVPLIIAPIFKYFLLIILPREGLIVEIMNLIRYSLR